MSLGFVSQLGDITVKRGGATSKIINYAGTMSTAVLAKAYGGASITPHRCAANGSLRAVMYKYSSQLYVRFSNDSGASYGTELRIDSVVSVTQSQNWDIKILSSTLMVVSYFDGSDNPYIVPITVSGNTCTLGSGYQILSGAISSLRYNCKMAVMSATRLLISYPNNSGYPSVIGVSFSGSTPTKDASATVMQSSAITGSGTSSRGKIDIAYTASGKAIAAFHTATTNAPQYCELTDSGSGTSVAVAATTGAGSESGGQLAILATSTAFLLVFGMPTAGGAIFTTGALSAGVIGTVSKDSSGDGKLRSAMESISPDLEVNYTWQGTEIGDTDNDGRQWFALPSTCASGKLRVLFVGVDPTLPSNIRQRVLLKANFLPNPDTPNQPPVLAKIDATNVFIFNKNQDDPTSDFYTRAMTF